MALSYASGVGLALSTSPVPTGLPLLLLPACLVLLLHRPWRLGVLAALATAGLIAGAATQRAVSTDCRLHLPRRWEAAIEGRFLTRAAPGRSLPFQIESGAPNDCRAVVRALVYEQEELPPTGTRIRIQAGWEGREFPRSQWAEWSGILRVRDGWSPAPTPGLRGFVLSLRGRVQDRIFALWGEEEGPVVEALVLARREHLDPDLREAFALSGTAHLLAISGFHVGVVAGLLLGLFRIFGARRRPSEVGAVLGCWAYVLGIGGPDAAVRAALILSLLAAARLRGRPVVASGALGTALLLLLAVDPRWMGSIGFQLSFAGTGGLVLLREPVARGFDRIWLRWIGTPLPTARARSPGMRLVRGGADGIAAGIAATLPTLPLVAWHFDRISLLGILATVVIAPVVATAIPGIGASLLLSLLPGGAGEFLAGGTGLLLQGVARFVLWVSSLPGASFWVARDDLIAALGSGVVVHFLLRWIGSAGRIGATVRHIAATTAGVAIVLLLPVLPLRGALELHMIDVGQGDAVALRFPSGRWALVDTGPRSFSFDAGVRRVLPYLRRQGARDLEAIVLTHPHLDHIGGAPALISEMNVRGVLDPSWATGSSDYLAVLQAARSSGASWWPALDGQSFEVDGVRVRVLHPDPGTVDRDRLSDENDLSVVLLLEWGEAAVLLTGDAPAGVEGRILDEVPHLTVLKVGHHGSRTSTSRELLERARPSVALIPVGDGNQFEHPHSEVVRRLRNAGTDIYRTDRDGDIQLTIRSNGTVESAGPP